MSTLALVGATVHSGAGWLPGATVLVEEATITAVGSEVLVPSDAEILDCAGRTITAGFWNSHVHFMENKWADAAAMPRGELAGQLAEMFVRYGFTTVFDISSGYANTQAIRGRVESGEVAGPAILTTGEALLAPGATPSRQTLRALGFLPATCQVGSVAEAVAAATALLEQGADGIKLHLQRPAPPEPPLPAEVIEAVVERAHAYGKPVFLHPVDAADVLLAARAGVDVVAHTTPRSVWDEPLLAAMHDAGVALTPTLTVWRSVMRHDRESLLRQFDEDMLEQLRDFSSGGGTVLFGTDVGATEYDPAPEYAMMARAGLDFRQILASLTTSPAERFGQGQRFGRVEPGYQADLVVLDGDPAQDLAALTRVTHTLRAGRIAWAAQDGS